MSKRKFDASENATATAAAVSDATHVQVPPARGRRAGASKHMTNDSSEVMDESTASAASASSSSSASAATSAAASSSPAASSTTTYTVDELQGDLNGLPIEGRVPGGTLVRGKNNRVYMIADIRPEQKTAMKRVATYATHGIECPSWYTFKSTEFVKKRSAAIGPGRQWRNHKQILDRENYHLLPPHEANYVSMQSSPSPLPSRKYCDLTGLPARYTDPNTQLHYYSSIEYQQMKGMPTEIIKQMLEIRGQTPTHQLILRG